MIYKLRYFVPFSTLKIVYYSMFHSHLQYSLLNWGRSSKSYLHQLRILQNKVLRAILFRPKQSSTTLLYSNLNILKLDDMINMEFAKFMFKFNNKMLPESFDCYFTKLDNIHKHNTRQKHRNEYYQFHTSSESGKKTLQYICLNVWKNIPKEYRHCSFLLFKNTIERISYQNIFRNKFRIDFFFKLKLFKKDGLTKSFETFVYSSVFLICN